MNLKITKERFLLLLLVMFYASAGLAQEHGSEDHAHQNKDEHHDEHQETHDDHNEDHGHHVYKNHLALFIGGTSNFDHDVNLFSLGVDYERRLPIWHEKIGVGYVFEFSTDGDINEIVTGVPVTLHPVGGLKLVVAPLAMFAKGGHGDSNEGDSGHHDDWSSDFAFRTAVGYDFHINSVSIGPLVAFDFAESMNFVYGLNLGLGF